MNYTALCMVLVSVGVTLWADSLVAEEERNEKQSSAADEQEKWKSEHARLE